MKHSGTDNTAGKHGRRIIVGLNTAYLTYCQATILIIGQKFHTWTMSVAYQSVGVSR